MWYTLSIALAVAGFMLFVVLVLSAVRGLRQFTSTVSMVRARTNDRATLLRARSAAVRVAVQRRRPVPESQ